MKAIINFFLPFKIFRKIINILNWEKNAYVETVICRQISPDNSVLAGPFKGMVYVELKASGSPMLPKIVGSYEDELHPIINRILPRNYQTVIDIGCAEGYYAVGLAMRLPEANIFAFDTDEVALERCKKMAEANKVLSRVEFGGFCDANMLRTFNYKHPSFIICDCEGYEKQLFVKDNITSLKNVDILIELHEYTAPGVTAYLTQLFKDSHHMEFIQSHAKHIRNYPVLKNIEQQYYRDSIMIERDDLMTWVFLEAKSGNA
jgi:Methyltransferase domain